MYGVGLSWVCFHINANFANIQLLLPVQCTYRGSNKSITCRLCSDNLDYHFRKPALVKRWNILNTYTLKILWIRETLQWVNEQLTGTQANQINDQILTLVLENPLHVFFPSRAAARYWWEVARSLKFGQDHPLHLKLQQLFLVHLFFSLGSPAPRSTS